MLPQDLLYSYLIFSDHDLTVSTRPQKRGLTNSDPPGSPQMCVGLQIHNTKLKLLKSEKESAPGTGFVGRQKRNSKRMVVGQIISAERQLEWKESDVAESA